MQTKRRRRKRHPKPSLLSVERSKLHEQIEQRRKTMVRVHGSVDPVMDFYILFEQLAGTRARVKQLHTKVRRLQDALAKKETTVSP